MFTFFLIFGVLIGITLILAYVAIMIKSKGLLSFALMLGLVLFILYIVADSPYPVYLPLGNYRMMRIEEHGVQQEIIFNLEKNKVKVKKETVDYALPTGYYRRWHQWRYNHNPGKIEPDFVDKDCVRVNGSSVCISGRYDVNNIPPGKGFDQLWWNIPPSKWNKVYWEYDPSFGLETGHLVRYPF